MIKNTNSRVTFTIDKELYKKALDRANEVDRTFSGYLCNLIKEDLKNK